MPWLRCPNARRSNILRESHFLFSWDVATNAEDGWVNVDLVPAKADLFWVLRNGIPFPDGSRAFFRALRYRHSE